MGLVRGHCWTGRRGRFSDSVVDFLLDKGIINIVVDGRPEEGLHAVKPEVVVV